MSDVFLRSNLQTSDCKWGGRNASLVGAGLAEACLERIKAAGTNCVCLKRIPLRNSAVGKKVLQLGGIGWLLSIYG